MEIKKVIPICIPSIQITLSWEEAMLLRDRLDYVTSYPFTMEFYRTLQTEMNKK